MRPTTPRARPAHQPPRAPTSRRPWSALFASAVVRLRWVVIVFWLAAAGALALLLPSIRDAQTGALGDLVPNEATAVETELRSQRLFGFPLLSRTLVVNRNPEGLSAADHLEATRLAVALNRGQLPLVDGIAGALLASNALGRPPFSRESSTTALYFLFFPFDIGQLGRTSLATLFAARHLEPAPGEFVGVTGAIPARYEQSKVIVESLPLVELATVILVGLAVGLHFRAVGAPLANLLAVAIAYLVSIRLVAWLGQQAGVSVPAEVQPVIVVLLFGVVTDYSIFFLARLRRRLAEGDEPTIAVERTTAELVPIITTSGLAVAGASGALVLAKLGFFQAFGPGVAMAILIALVVSLTLIPACLAVGGRAMFWPRAPAPGPSPPPGHPRGDGLAGVAVRLAVGHPWLVIVGCLLAIGGAASGVTQLRVGNPVIRGLPADSEPRRAYAQAGEGFAPGILSPTVVVVEGRGITQQRAALARLQRALESHRGVAEVVGPADNPTGINFGAALSPTGNAARFLVVFRSDPLGAFAISRLTSLQAATPSLLRGAGLPGASASFAGDTALVAETIAETRSDLGGVIPAALAAVALVLVVFLRSLVAPLYLVAAAALAPLAALGLTVYLFQDLLAHSELTYFVPVAATVLLVALGSDYNVFLAGRVWAEARKRELREALVVGGIGASQAISAAGLVLAASFALLALVPLRAFQELAFVMAVGLIIDAFLVRALLVPAVIAVTGYLSGWPGKRLRRSGSRAGERAGAGAGAS